MAEIALKRDELLKADNVVLAGLFLLALIFGYLSFAPSSLSVREGQGEKVALISDVDSTVKKKPAGAIAWDEADSRDDLYTGDQIFTDKNSGARVRFGDGSEISIAENSLVKIEKQDGRTTLDMSKGFVSGRFGAGRGGTDFAIKMGGTEVKLDRGAELQVKVDPNDPNATRVALVSGEAEIKGPGGKEIQLGKNQVLSVDTETGMASVKEIGLKLVLPRPDESIDAQDNPAVFFKWESRAQGVVYTLTVAKDASFKELVTERQTSNKALSIQAPPSGAYFWKVRSVDPTNGKVDESIESRFGVTRIDAPEPLAPHSGKAFTTEHQDRPVTVTFLWRSLPMVKSFDVEVARDSAFKDKVLSRRVADSTLETKELGEGSFFWRVRGRGQDDAKAGPYSAAQDFQIARVGAAEAPLLVEPNAGDRFAPSTPITFRWEPQPGVNAYRFELSRSKSFAAGPGTVTRPTEGNALTLAPELPGQHYWRVKAVDSFGRDTPYSEARPILLDSEAPRLVAPEDGAEIMIAQKDLRIDFGWVKSGGAKAYTIEIAKDPAFASPVRRQRIEGTSYGWSELAPGQYFWRVRPEIPGVKEATPSAVRRLDLKRLDLLPPPNLKDKYYFRLPAPAGPGTALLRGLFKLLASSGTAYAQDATAEYDPQDSGQVVVSWKPIAGADAYYVEVASDREFASSLVKRRTKAPTFVWPEAAAGRYYLRAASLDPTGQPGKYSRIAELIVNHRAPKLYEPADQAALPGGKAPVDFTWENVGGAPELTLEVATTADFKQVVQKKVVQGGTTKLDAFPPGSYYWRVKARYRSDLPWEAAKPWRFGVAKPKGPVLKAPLIAEPAPGAVLTTEGELLQVKALWSEVEHAEKYQVQIARDEAFGDVALDQDANERELVTELKPGNYFLRVKALGPEQSASALSETRPFQIKTVLPAPLWVKPDQDQEFVMAGKAPVKADLEWQSVIGAQSYEVEIAKTKTFAKVWKDLKGTAVKASLSLPKGQYHARVHAITPSGERSAPSEPRSFTVVEQTVDAPDLIYPEDGDQLTSRQSVRLTWSKENAFTGYRVVVSRDPKFKQVVYDGTVASDGKNVKLPKGGKYYWYVEGKDKAKKYAMRSDVNTFNVSNYQPAGYDRVRVMAAFAPSVVSNTMVSDAINNSLGVAVYNSFAFSGQYWLTRPVGIEAAYQRKSAELYENEDSLEGSADQEKLEFIPQSFDLRAKLRLLLGKSATSPELHARGGYMYKTFYTYYAESRTALGLQETTTHSASLGVGAKLPLGLDHYLEGALDVAKPLASSGAKVTGGQHFMADAGYYLLFPSRLTAGAGYRFANATYAFTDDAHGVTGVLQEKSYSVLGLVGYGF